MNNDCREALKNGCILCHGNMQIEIKNEIGRGGNSIVYLGEYPDSVIKEKTHRCIVKELFPYHSKGLIERSENNNVIWSEDCGEFMEMHRKSFIHGNRMHLDVLYKSPLSADTNIDSFEANNTLYTILGFDGASALSKGTKKFKTLKEASLFILDLLSLLESFHKNNILHLDISPDNIIVSDEGSRIMLIDFNGSAEISSPAAEYFSVNPLYSPPELKLGRKNELCPASDIFSVCAVFVYIITGKSFDYVGFNPKSLENERLLDGISPTARQYLFYILSKGLRTKPRLRFKSVSELKEALIELNERIDGAGVTHASLWEISRRTAVKPSSEIIDNYISLGDEKASANELKSFKNIVLYGSGGIGKTTLFKKLVYENTRAYSPKEAVPIYIPLYDYDGKHDFIKRYIASKITYNEKITDINEAVKRFKELAEKREGLIYLLLDGYNEISADGSNLIREINELSNMKGIGLAVSSRTASVSEKLSDNFFSVRLLPLDEEGIKEYLNKHGTAFPSDKNLLTLLANPLMLTLYTKANEVYRSSEKAAPEYKSQEEIIQGYLESLCEVKRSKPGEDSSEAERFEYVIKFLFPTICVKLKNGGELSYENLRKICSADYKRLKSKAFSKAFPEYAGRSRAILGGVKTADEWADMSVNKILAEEAALIVRSEGKYRVQHMNFAESVYKNHFYNMKKYVRAFLFEKSAFIAVIIICLCLGGYCGIYFAPHTHPLGKTEERKCTEALSVISSYVNKAVNMSSYERIIADSMDYGGRGSLYAYETTVRNIETLSYDKRNDIDSYAFRGLDTEMVNELGETVSEHYDFWLNFSERLERILEPESSYSDDYIDEIRDNYNEYLNTFEKLIGYEVYLSVEQLRESSYDDLYKSICTYSAISEAYGEASALGTTAAKENKEALKRKLKEKETFLVV